MNTITVQDQTHLEPQQSLPHQPPHEVTPQISDDKLAEEPAINKADHQVEEVEDPEKIEVLGDKGVLKPKVKKVRLINELIEKGSNNSFENGLIF